MYPTPFMNGKRLNSFPRLAVLGLCGVLCGGCSSDGDATDGSGSCSVSGQTKGAIVTFGTFARIQSEEGLVSEGLNLDDVTTNEGDVTGCAKPDFTTPEGTEGIDNQFGLILKLMEEVGGAENLDALITGAFSSGQLAYMMAVEGIDDPENDDCVNMTFGSALGDPQYDTNGKYLAYQTFGFDDSETPTSHFIKGRIVDGMLEAQTEIAYVPVRVLDAAFDIPVHQARIKMRVTADPTLGGISLDGYIGGGVESSLFSEVIPTLNIGGDVVETALPLLGVFSDLGMDEEGSCSQLSVALRFESTPAFVHQP